VKSMWGEIDLQFGKSSETFYEAILFFMVVRFCRFILWKLEKCY